ncbi:MAG: hypothetical protein U0T02_04110 [Solirubrobacteraceae bacterium]
MPEPTAPRSVKISADERTGWSSDRPRRDGASERPADISTRCRVLRPADRLRYSPGSLLVIVSAASAEAERLAARVIEDSGAVLSPGKVRRLIEGRVPAERLEGSAAQLLEATVQRRLAAGQTIVYVAETLDPAEREGWVRMAAASRRPRHMLLLEVARDQVAEESRAELNALRRALDAGELGAEGFQTALRLGGGAVGELKRIVFQPAPRDE